MEHEHSKEQLAKLSIVEVPDGVIGNIHQFRNFDPSRILHYELKEDRLLIYMEESVRVESINDFHSTVEAFRYEVERGVRPEVEAFRSFTYNADLSELKFTVDREIFEQDITAEMIEISIVEDAIKFQIYSRKPIGVQVYYHDDKTKLLFEQRAYPESR
ncbi:hypothetical protein ACTHOQ_02155 [Solibacillus silvestris]|uniref:hypothetical protein n=1 Tax=Solibacillus silvestris TaxID=76853 RepID=UPI003F7F011D